MIVGGSGAGKSTLAQDLAVVSKLPSYHVDQLLWRPGFILRRHQETVRLAREIHSKERWIFEGGLTSTYAERAARADVLIWLDLPVGLRMWRVLLRAFRYHNKVRPYMSTGCREKFGPHTIDVVRFVWKSRKTNREQILKMLESASPELEIVHLRSARQVKRFVARCGGRTDEATLLVRKLPMGTSGAICGIHLVAALESCGGLPLV